ncbi:hypothetical protein [Microbacterium lacus]|uniref:hypothetical protein n=1 Tax=Microbacterium lacus TaxID=415217 RepID=UPI0034DD5651
MIVEGTLAAGTGTLAAGTGTLAAGTGTLAPARTRAARPRRAANPIAATIRTAAHAAGATTPHSTTSSIATSMRTDAASSGARARRRSAAMQHAPIAAGASAPRCRISPTRGVQWPCDEWPCDAWSSCAPWAADSCA